MEESEQVDPDTLSDGQTQVEEWHFASSQRNPPFPRNPEKPHYLVGRRWYRHCERFLALTC